MNGCQVREQAWQPEDSSRLVVGRLNAGDVDGLVALYEPDMVLALPDGGVAAGSSENRTTHEHFVAAAPAFTPGRQLPTVRNGDVALTSVRLGYGGVIVEVARRQADGTWLWMIDQPI
ncbi:YybH family protein [Nocardia sp. NPDC051750]|uniref:YybH family protein n=1 Tax=Nocardia sp. NPDC051750 TaxID=3364325 RepID=UPI0037B5E645